MCAHDPCTNLGFTASKYGQFPPPIHGKFLQLDPPTDLSSLAPASEVSDLSASATDAIPSIVEQPTSSTEHAPTGCPPTEDNEVAAELVAPTVVEPVLTVVGPTELIAPTVVGPPTISGTDCANELAAAEPSQPTDLQIDGPQVAPDDERNACDQNASASAPVTPCQDDSPQFGAATESDNDVACVDPHSMLPPPVSPTTEILKFFDDLDEQDRAHGGGPDLDTIDSATVAEPAENVKADVATLPEVVQPEVATLPEIEKPATADVKGSAEFSADVNEPSIAPLAMSGPPAPPAPPSPSQVPVCPRVFQVLKLAEELRKSSAYCGPYVFVLFCLYYGVRMTLWSGDQCTDLVDEYIPWAAEHCKTKSPINAIFCAFKVDSETGVSSIRPACEATVGELNHFVATLTMQAPVVTGQACETSLETFYLPKGQCPLPTVAEGNCSMDICVQSRGLPQTPEEFQAMRDRLAE